MDKKNKIFFAILFLLIIGSIGATYWRIMVKKNYVVEAQIECDPAVEECFVWECDPDSQVEGEACIGDPESDIWYYKIAKRKAANIPLCDPEKDEACDPWACEDGEKDCEEAFCDEESKVEQEAECNDPEEYLKNNPSGEEEGISFEGETAEELEGEVMEEIQEDGFSESEEVGESEEEIGDLAGDNNEEEIIEAE